MDVDREFFRLVSSLLREEEQGRRLTTRQALVVAFLLPVLSVAGVGIVIAVTIWIL